MGYKGAGYIIIKPDIYQQLIQYKEDGETWNSFILKVIKLIEKDIENDKTQQ